MQGKMMQQPLLVSSLLSHAERHHGDQKIISRRFEGDIHSYSYCELAERTRRLANILDYLCIQQGDRIGTMAWNDYRHMELYYGISSYGAVLHTVNPRLHVDQIAYIINHADDQVLFFDPSFLSIIQDIHQKLPNVRAFVLLAGRDHMPKAHGLSNLLCYEEMLESATNEFTWPELDENVASSLCYTSGTTGNPKGVLYSHRSTLLHTFAMALPDVLNCSSCDTIMPVVPMFHVNAWGLPYAACMVGARLVYPGASLDGMSLYELIESEQVTVTAGVPSVWQGLLSYVTSNNLRFSSMNATIIGGAPCPPAMIREFQNNHQVKVRHAWGMTELSPLGTAAAPKQKHMSMSEEIRFDIQAKQGRVICGVDMKIVNEHGTELPWDGKTSGELLVRGHWVAAGYFAGEGGDPLVKDAAGREWFPTGDIATIDHDGYMHITDRSKDVIKSGGEWISSIDLENIAASHPGIAIVACIAARHPKWGERPVLLAVRKPTANVSRVELIEYFKGKIARWWMPDDVIFIDTIPLGATGKILKSKLREQYGGCLM